MSLPKRVSKRKTKGQNKYLESILQEENDSFSLLMSNNDSDNNIKINREYTVYCSVCNTNDDNYDELTDPFGDMIQCDKCDTWQHINCILQNQNEPIEHFFTTKGKYICNLCDPKRYPHLMSLTIQNKEDDNNNNNNNNNTSNNDLDQDFDYENDHDNNYTITQENENDNDLDLNDDIYESDDNKPKAQLKKRNTSNNHNKKTSTTTKSNINKQLIQNISSNEIKPDLKSNRIRDNASKMFIDLFNKFIIPDTINNHEYVLPTNKSIEDIAQEMGKSLETNLFEFVNENKPIMLNPKLYSEKVRMIYSNVKDVKNLQLKCHIMNGHLTLTDLVKLDSAQLINPDLQSFKKTIDSRIMDQVVFETPSERPLYVKTHKGEELIERDSDNNTTNNNSNGDNQTNITTEGDFLVKDNIMTVHNDDTEINHDKNDNNHSIVTDPIISQDTSIKQVQDNKVSSSQQPSYNQRVNINIPDIFSNPILLINNALYLSCSNKQLRHPYKECLLDGNLRVEGKLTTLKAYKYLNEIKSSRNILAYYLKDYSINNYNEIVDWMLINDKVLGIRCGKVYVKNVYLISSDSGEYPSIINDLFPEQEFSELIKYSEPKLFLLVVIKPELIH